VAVDASGPWATTGLGRAWSIVAVAGFERAFAMRDWAAAASGLVAATGLGMSTKGGQPKTVDASGPWVTTGLGKAHGVEAAARGNFNVGRAVNGTYRQRHLLDGLLGTSVRVE
jgi:hypothetical protein